MTYTLTEDNNSVNNNANDNSADANSVDNNVNDNSADANNVNGNTDNSTVASENDVNDDTDRLIKLGKNIYMLLNYNGRGLIIST